MGERGEIVYTNLYNYGMPFIRYRIGDVGIPTDEKCPCGRGLPLMKIIEGRTDDFMKLSSGNIIAPTIWIIILMHYDIENYKVIQEKKNEIRLLIVPGRNFTKESINNIRKEIIEVLKEEITLQIELVEEIPREKSGKVKPIVSKVQENW
jgi:phenylacetate-CoA ligase